MPRPRLHDRVEALRTQRVAQDRTRTRRSVSRRDGVRFEVDGHWLTGFCSNDYLGLAQQFAVVNALQDSASREGAGGIASHLVCGHHAAHDALERELADWLGAPRALLFGSGYLANLAVMQSLLGDEDVVRAGPAQPRQPDRCARASAVATCAAIRMPIRKARCGNCAACRKARRCSRPTACSAWTATSRRCANWP